MFSQEQIKSIMQAASNNGDLRTFKYFESMLKNEKTILGIDVGATGALSFYNKDELIIYDMPVFERNKTTRVDCHYLAKILEDNAADHAWIEQVNSFGMGAGSAFNFGWNCGCIEAVLSTIGIPFSYVTPQVWKKDLSVPTDKNATKTRIWLACGLHNYFRNSPITGINQNIITGQKQVLLHFTDIIKHPRRNFYKLAIFLLTHIRNTDIK